MVIKIAVFSPEINVEIRNSRIAISRIETVQRHIPCLAILPSPVQRQLSPLLSGSTLLTERQLFIQKQALFESRVDGFCSEHSTEVVLPKRACQAGGLPEQPKQVILLWSKSLELLSEHLKF